MAKSKNNNALYIGIGIAVVVVIAIIVAVVMINKNKGSDNGGDNTGSSDDSSLVEYDTVDETIELGDYEGMQTLSKAIQNGEKVGSVVKIHGFVSHPMSTYSVVQENEDGTQKIGTQFIIDGGEDSDYPEDGVEVVITGEVVEKSPMYFVIETTTNNIEVQ